MQRYLLKFLEVDNVTPKSQLGATTLVVQDGALKPKSTTEVVPPKSGFSGVGGLYLW